ncbi:helix-turn-helix domain-containing protein [Salipaludibacillus sp. CF4.18]|uniref:helix-turn-helix domain-containing protein n=1 Tax=Salipaludibacillus sp. CF4.18 TaxID=3373081 RepID=UPI003EE5F4AA
MTNNLFGFFLRKIRKENKLTLKELANKLELTHGYISNVENSKMKANLDLIEGIYSILQIPLEESLIRLKIDNGDFQEFINSLNRSNFNYGKSNLMTKMYNSRPGKFILFTLRLKSNKTLNEISNETSLSIEEIINIENIGPQNEDALKKLGESYNIRNLLNFLNHEYKLPPISIKRAYGLIGRSVTELEEARFTLWGDFNEINKHENQDYSFFDKKIDLYYLLKENENFAYKDLDINEAEINKMIKIFDAVFGNEEIN